MKANLERLQKKFNEVSDENGNVQREQFKMIMNCKNVNHYLFNLSILNYYLNQILLSRIFFQIDYLQFLIKIHRVLFLKKNFYKQLMKLYLNQMVN